MYCDDTNREKVVRGLSDEGYEEMYSLDVCSPIRGPVELMNSEGVLLADRVHCGDELLLLERDQPEGMKNGHRSSALALLVFQLRFQSARYEDPPAAPQSLFSNWMEHYPWPYGI